jgi:hypothetical protein
LGRHDQALIFVGRRCQGVAERKTNGPGNLPIPKGAGRRPIFFLSRNRPTALHGSQAFKLAAQWDLLPVNLVAELSKAEMARATPQALTAGELDL